MAKLQVHILNSTRLHGTVGIVLWIVLSRGVAESNGLYCTDENCVKRTAPEQFAHQQTVGENLLQRKTSSREKARVHEFSDDVDDGHAHARQQKPDMFFQIEAEKGTVDEKVVGKGHVSTSNPERQFTPTAAFKVPGYAQVDSANAQAKFMDVSSGTLNLACAAAMFAFGTLVKMLCGAGEVSPILKSRQARLGKAASKDIVEAGKEVVAEMGKATDEIKASNDLIKQCWSKEEQQLLEWASSESEPEAESEA